MNALSWQQDWEMGDDRLDGQHMAMIRAINHLTRRLEEGRAKEGINRSITFLMMYVEVHFREEEEAMERAGYPGLAGHAAQHRECSRRIGILMDKWRDGHSDVLPDLLTFFNFWLASHLGGADRRFAEFRRTAA